MNLDQKKAFLTDHFAFENLSDADVDYLANNSQIRILDAGETLFVRDDPSVGLKDRRIRGHTNQDNFGGGKGTAPQYHATWRDVWRNWCYRWRCANG